MDEKATGTLGGRPVELRVVGFGYALDSQEVMEKTGSGFKAALVLLAPSAHWQDTGERVFADVDAIRAWPMTDHADIVKLAGQASEINWAAVAPKPNGVADDVAGVHISPSH